MKLLKLPFLPLGDTIDRLSIHILYARNAPAEYEGDAHAAYQAYFDLDDRLSQRRKRYFLKRLLAVNAKIWPNEAKIREAARLRRRRVDKETLLAVRDGNRERSSIKREINRESRRFADPKKKVKSGVRS